MPCFDRVKSHTARYSGPQRLNCIGRACCGRKAWAFLIQNYFPHPDPLKISENTAKLRILPNCIQPQSTSLFPSCCGHQWMNSIQYLSADLSADLWVNALIKLEPCIKSCIQRCQSAPAGWSETRSWPYHRDVGTRASVVIVTVCQSTGTCN